MSCPLWQVKGLDSWEEYAKDSSPKSAVSPGTNGSDGVIPRARPRLECHVAGTRFSISNVTESGALTKWISKEFQIKAASISPCGNNINPLCSLLGGLSSILVPHICCCCVRWLYIDEVEGGGSIIEYPHHGGDRVVSFLHIRLRQVVGEGEAGLPLRLCVWNTLLSACTHPRLQQALTAAPALLTAGLIYAIKELIRVINSARARAQPGPYSQLWNCYNPPPSLPPYTQIHPNRTKNYTHSAHIHRYALIMSGAFVSCVCVWCQRSQRWRKGCK